MNPCAPWLLVVVLAAACAPAGADRETRPAAVDHVDPAAARVGHRRAADAASLLRAWDRRRARAWWHGDAVGLAGLYTRDSRAGHRDRAMLGAYADRGLRVAGLRTQVLALSVRGWRPGRVTVEVTDRLVGGEAVGHGVRIPLPRDNASTRVVSLRRVSGSWRVVEVRDQ